MYMEQKIKENILKKGNRDEVGTKLVYRNYGIIAFFLYISSH